MSHARTLTYQKVRKEKCPRVIGGTNCKGTFARLATPFLLVSANRRASISDLIRAVRNGAFLRIIS